jgi:two-component system sensor histidine kinase HydH
VIIVAFVLGVACGVAAAWLLLGRRASRRDNAESAQLHAEAAEAIERLTELATLTGGLAHEIRNPLSTLKVNLQVLAENWRDANEAAESDLCRRSLAKIETLRGEADRLQQILDDFLHYIGRHELSRTPIDLNEIVDDMLVFFRPQALSQKVQIRASLSPEPLVCDVDPAKFKQAFLNLLVNSQQAMPDGGDLIVRSGKDADGRATVEVADTGCGISSEDLGKIFQPYFSTKREGTGLGLPTTRRIIQAHGGTVGVHTEPGRGSSFTLHLPLSAQKEP